jgi:disulfide bond formation protein DsbB
MINALTGLGYGIIGLAILIGIGIVIMSSMSSTVAGCSTGWTYNATNERCCYTGTPCTGTVNSSSPSTASQTLNTISGTYVGTNLVAWIPVVIVLVIGLLFLGAFISRKGSQS